MRLERLTAAIRPRRPWESVDLGFALARRWFPRLWALWWLAALPPALLLAFPLRAHPDLWLLLLWWLKPLYESLLLYWLGHALFGDALTVSAAARQLGRAFPPRLWPQLLWRRLSPKRAVTMPVTLLERLSGTPRRERLRVLTDQRGVATWLTIICMHLEAVLWLSGLLLAVLLLPAPLPAPDLGAMLLADRGLAGWAVAVTMLAAMSVIAPFYSAAGFALYLGRRTELEAWDLELRFRRAGQRSGSGPGFAHGPARRRVPHRMATMLLPALAVMTACIAPQPAAADGAPVTAQQARAAIEAVLTGGDFGAAEERAIWVYVGPTRDAEPEELDTPWTHAGPLLQALAAAVKWLLAIGAALLVLLLLWRLRQELAGRRARPRRRPGGEELPPPAEIPASGLPPLPDDITAAVRAALATGEARRALSLLYRGQITHLRESGLDIADSATELDCLAAARRTATPRQWQWQERLTRLWQAVAYAHAPAEPDAIRALLATRPLAHDAATANKTLP